METKITVTYDQIKATNFFKSMSKINQKIFLNRNTHRVIENGVNVVHHLGFEQWKAQTAFNYKNEEIIKELTNN